ncbi:glycosyltransferase [Paractinoplanes ferrugineus]|uniref:4,4'-diaponeurosporenoate glycosyltransferase n=1 Tax=Paractinoplanes ferrugineus TaxID=113564 RepID=A0A919MHH4_9ACTN|nr:glycosyltransferase [Actinoplanes ferrugineus]GIE14959.1 glycosyl transferase [Actinoplanes ferrugineus]
MHRVAVVVPAHDESALLPACLAALRVAAAGVAPVPVRVIVVADACTDDTERLARAGGADVVTIGAGNVGRARAAGVAYAMSADAGALWLATTDADSRVPPEWLRWQARHAERGADLVAGTVEVDDWSQWAGPMPARYERRYLELVAGLRHGHIHGANLGFRASAYAAAGGFPGLAHDEDRELVARFHAAGATVVTDTGCPVRTSARPDGRAPLGFSAHLLSLATE